MKMKNELIEAIKAELGNPDIASLFEIKMLYSEIFWQKRFLTGWRRMIVTAALAGGLITLSSLWFLSEPNKNLINLLNILMVILAWMMFALVFWLYTEYDERKHIQKIRIRMKAEPLLDAALKIISKHEQGLVQKYLDRDQRGG